jgi:hypothetical protein
VGAVSASQRRESQGRRGGADDKQDPIECRCRLRRGAALARFALLGVSALVIAGQVWVSAELAMTTLETRLFNALIFARLGR